MSKSKAKSSTTASSGKKETSASASTALKKITPMTVMKSAGGVPKPAVGETIPLFTLIGRALKTKNGKTQFGEWTGFVGIFEAVRQDGVKFRSSVTILREPFESLFADALRAAHEEGNRAGIEFALRFSVEHSEKGNTGYAYVVESLINEEAAADPLANLRERAALSYQG